MRACEMPAPVGRRSTGARAAGLLLAAAFAGLHGWAQAPAPGAPLRLTLADALQRAKTLSPELETALTNVKIAAEDVAQARAATLPTVTGNSEYLYTEGNGTPAARFIANNGVHEYIAQGDAHESLSASLLIAHRRAVVLAAVARDQAEIAHRGLVVAVVQAYAGLVAANGKLASARDALQAAQRFVTVTEQLESGGEVARADVVKAKIQVNDSTATVDSLQLAQEQAQLSLALLVFPSVSQSFTVADDPAQMLELPAFQQAREKAQQSNPQIAAAKDTEHAAATAVTQAWAGYLPSLSFDAFYGIDANQFALRTRVPGSTPTDNLGYSGLLALSIPVFNWGATHSQVKQARYRKQQAVTALSYAQRKAQADLTLLYHAAQEAREEMNLRKQAQDEALQSRDLTLLQYKAGMNTALEVVNAESTLNLEQTAYFDAESRYATALANLATLTGSLNP